MFTPAKGCLTSNPDKPNKKVGGLLAQTDSQRPVNVVCEDTLSGLKQHAVQWNELVRNSSNVKPFLTHTWVESHLQLRLTPDQSWYCLFAYDQQQLIGVLPLIVEHRSILGVSRPIFSTPFDYHTMMGDFVVDESRRQQVITMLIRYINDRWPRHMGILLERLPPSSPTVRTVSELRKCAAVVRNFSDRGGYLRTDRPHADYIASLSRHFVKQLTRRRRKLSQMETIEFVTISNHDVKPEHFDDVVWLEGSGWKGRSGSAIAKSTSLEKFYRYLTGRLAEQEWLTYYFLRADQKNIACCLAINFNGHLTLLKIGYDEKYGAISPGNLLRENIIEQAFASDSVVEVDFLSYHSFHERWNLETRDYVDVRIYPRHLWSLMFGYLPRATRVALKRIPLARRAYRAIKKLRGS